MMKKVSFLALFLVLFLLCVQLNFGLPPPPPPPDFPSGEDLSGEETGEGETGALLDDGEEAGSDVTETEEGTSSSLVIAAIIIVLIFIFLLVYYLKMRKK